MKITELETEKNSRFRDLLRGYDPKVNSFAVINLEHGIHIQIGEGCLYSREFKVV